MRVRSHDPADMITHKASVAYDATATCSLWNDCVTTWMGGDADKMDYLQRLGGYCLRGGNPSRVFPVWYGGGRNGKSVCADTWRGMLGSYAKAAPRGLLAEKGHDGHPTELANLRGCRLVIASETKQNMALSTDLVKVMTGETVMSARHMRQDYFEFRVTHKTILMTNSLPLVRDTSDSIWDRVHLLEWNVRIPDDRVDPELGTKLKAEWPGILNWMLAGAEAVRANRWILVPPPAVKTATQAYRSDCDLIGRFADELLVMDNEDATVTVRQLRQSFDQWCEDCSEKFHPSPRVFNAWFRQRGKEDRPRKFEGKVEKTWFGVGLR